MKFKQVAQAYLNAIQIIFANRKLRILFLQPFIAALVALVVSLSIGVYYFPDLLAYLRPEVSGLLADIITPFIWIAALLILFVASLLIVIILTLSLLGVLQTPIAREVLRIHSVEVKEQSGGTVAIIAMLLWELAKLIMTICLTIPAILIGLFPPLIPLALLISGWIIGFQSYDVVLDALGVRIRDRLGIILRQPGVTLTTGTAGVLLALVPLMTIVVPSLAVCASALLVANRNFTASNDDTK